MEFSEAASHKLTPVIIPKMAEMLTNRKKVIARKHNSNWKRMYYYLNIKSDLIACC